MRVLLVLLCCYGLLLPASNEPITVPANCASDGSTDPAVHLAGARSTYTGLPSGHAHNDYRNHEPLTDALASGFTSLEVDVWNVDGELLVAHTTAELDPARTLESLYLGPLARRRVAATGPLQLVIDVKSDAASTVPVIERTLQRYRHLLTSYRGCAAREGMVSVVLSGNARPRGPGHRTTDLYAYDFQPERDSGSTLARAPVPLVSVDWGESFAWTGEGPAPDEELARLRALVDTAHARGARIRFWAAPDAPGPARTAVWSALAAADVDYINTDDPEAYEEFATR